MNIVTTDQHKRGEGVRRDGVLTTLRPLSADERINGWAILYRRLWNQPEPAVELHQTLGVYK